MTRNEVIKLIGVVVVAYPNFDKFRDEKHIQSMVGVWLEMFAEDDARLVGMAVKQHISLSKWPPSIAEIREIMVDITNPDIIPPDEAWEAVSKLMYAQGEHCHVDLFHVLPRPIAEAVEAVGYGQLYALRVAYARGSASKAGLDHVAFIQAYEGKIERQRKKASLPGKLREQIEAVSATMSDGSRLMLADINNRFEGEKEFYKNLTNRNYQNLLKTQDDFAD